MRPSSAAPSIACCTRTPYGLRARCTRSPSTGPASTTPSTCKWSRLTRAPGANCLRMTRRYSWRRAMRPRTLSSKTSKVTLKALDDAKTNGVHLCTPSQQELQRLRQATDVVLDEIAQQQTDKGKQLDDILARYRGMAKQLGPAEGDMTPCAAQ